MEYENSSKTIDWATIVEYFTKRGRPLTKEEIKKLVDEDKREREEEADRLRANEEAERRRMARLMDRIEDEEDYEAYMMRQKNEKDNVSSDEDQVDRDSQDGSGSFSSDGSRLSGEGSYDYDSEDELEREERGGKRRHRRSGRPTGLLKSSKSAKTLDKAGNLRKSRLSKEDYADQRRSSMSRGRYQITVPKPFKFDIREKVRPKTIRERKIDEMVAEKKLEEDVLVKHQFRCKPIPADVLIPRYQAILEKNEQRRMQVKKDSIALTKQREAPFSFWERDKNK